MSDDRPSAAIGHMDLPANDINESYDFYLKLGLRGVFCDDKLGIVELRGGTHLILRKEPHADTPTTLDLMIPERGYRALEAYREGLTRAGLTPPEIPRETHFGHSVLTLKDPAGNEISIFNSHIEGVV